MWPEPSKASATCYSFGCFINIAILKFSKLENLNGNNKKWISQTGIINELKTEVAVMANTLLYGNNMALSILRSR